MFFVDFIAEVNQSTYLIRVKKIVTRTLYIELVATKYDDNRFISLAGGFWRLVALSGLSVWLMIELHFALHNIRNSYFVISTIFSQNIW